MATNRTDCAHFYGVNGTVLGSFVQYLEAVLTRPAGHPEGGPMHYDGAINMFRERTATPTLFATPSLGWKRSSRSDIAPNRWYDELPLARRLIGGVRRIRDLVKPRPS